jgi:hypothetical protein
MEMLTALQRRFSRTSPVAMCGPEVRLMHCTLFLAGLLLSD